MLIDNANGVIFHTELYSHQIEGNWFFEGDDKEIKEKYLI